MRRRGKFPAWLTRRGYFARFQRWTKPKRKRGAAESPAAIVETAADAVGPSHEVLPSNVLPFPEQPGGHRAGEVRPMRRLGSA